MCTELFIRQQVEPEVKPDLSSAVTLYGHSRNWYAYKPEHSGMPVAIGNDYPGEECAALGRLNCIGA
jgi:hypothetical protein